MSLVSLAARIIFTKLVRGQTFAGNAVLNAPLEPIEAVTKDMLPVVAVYTGVLKSKPGTRDALGARGEMEMELVFQAYIPVSVDPTGELAGLNLLSGGAAVAIDLLQRQVLSALQSQSNDWHELWATLVRGYTELDSKPVLIEVEGGVRIPCREVSLTCSVISDPAPGAPLNAFWTQLDTKLRSEPGTVQVADLIKAAIEQPGDLSEWRQVMARLGLSRAAVVASGIGPVEPAITGDPEPAVLEEVTTYPATIETVVSPGDSFSEEENP